LGTIALQPHSRHFLWMARQRIFDVPLLRGADAFDASCAQSQTRLGTVCVVELCCCFTGLVVGSCRYQPAAGVGRVSPDCGCIRGACIPCIRSAVLHTTAEDKTVKAICFRLVHSWCAHIYALCVSHWKCCSSVIARCSGRCFQWALDP